MEYVKMFAEPDFRQQNFAEKVRKLWHKFTTKVSKLWDKYNKNTKIMT